MNAEQKLVIRWNGSSTMSDIMKSSVAVQLSKTWITYPLNEITVSLEKL